MTVEFLDDEAIADIAFIVRSPTLDDLFREACEAVFHLQTDTDRLNTSVEYSIAIEGRNLERLLYDVLSEIIFYRDAEFFFGKSARIVVDETEISAKGMFFGEIFDEDRHVRWNDVKAITMHDFYVKQMKAGWEAYVLVDI